MQTQGERTPNWPDESANSTTFAALHPAHLTHEPVRRSMPWARFVGAVAVGGVVVEVIRLVFGA